MDLGALVFFTININSAKIMRPAQGDTLFCYTYKMQRNNEKCQKFAYTTYLMEIQNYASVVLNGNNGSGV